MLVKELFKDAVLDPSFSGYITADNMVLAVDISESGNADIDDYAVAQAGLKSTSGTLNPEKKTTAYIRQGKNTVKTGNQRAISFEADAYAGDPFQDFVLSHKMKYATGQNAVRGYVYFNMLTGKGEKGKGTILIDTDASGNAEDNLGISGSIEKAEGSPEEITYQGFGDKELLTSAPDDWTASYSSYFERRNGAFAAAAAVSGGAPEWTAGKYYKTKTVS